MLTSTQTAQLEKIAKMVLYEIPHSHIAASVNLSEEALAKIFQRDEFKAVLEQTANEQFEEQQTLNSGWDSLEQTAVAHVLEAMQIRPDPEFALKVAAVANKANRRSTRNHEPIQGNLGVRAVVNLNVNFVDKLQQNFTVQNQREHRQEHGLVKRQQVNMMGVSQVEKFLGNKSKEEDILGELDFAVP